MSIAQAHDGGGHVAAADQHAKAAARAFPDPSKLRSRDVFRLGPRAWPFIRPFRRHLLYLMLAMIPGLPGTFFGIYMSQIFLDAVGDGKPLTPIGSAMLHLPIHASREVILWRACILISVFVLVAVPYGLFLFSYAIWILQRITNQFRVDLYTRLQELSLRFHSEEKIGDAIFRMFQDSAVIPQAINGVVIQPLRRIPFSVASFIALILYDYRMAAVAAMLLPVHFLLAAIFAGPMRRAFLAEREATADATTRIEETLASIKAVKAFGRESAEDRLYADDNWNAFLAARRARMMLVVYRVLSHLARGLAYVAAVYLGAREVMRGGHAGIAYAAVSLGLFQGSLGAFQRLAGNSHALTDLWGSLQDVVVAVSRVFEMMAKTPEERVKSGTAQPPAARAALAFEHVSFGYEQRATVLRDVGFQAPVGAVTALAGPSGSGKSTLIALILRFFDPAHGRIVLDGRDIREFDLGAWRATIAVALQDSPLFTATLRENLAYGRADAGEKQIARAIARAGLASFVRSLPAGLDTILGEKGAKISAGQAQRIGLARAFLRGAPILILDEPTSALDRATEETVMRGVRDWLDERPRERLCILATHRRSTAARADRVYRIAAGSVVEADGGAFEPLPAVEESGG